MTTNKFTKLFMFVYTLCQIYKPITAETFVVHFQSSTNGSQAQDTNEWAEYTAKIPAAKDFTACNWMKINYFSKETSVVVWTYCTKTNASVDEISCLDMFLKSSLSSARRNLESLICYHQTR